MQHLNLHAKDLLERLWDILCDSNIIIPVTTKDGQNMDKLFVEKINIKNTIRVFLTLEDTFLYGRYVDETYKKEIAFTKMKLGDIIKTINHINSVEPIITDCSLCTVDETGEIRTLESIWSNKFN